MLGGGIHLGRTIRGVLDADAMFYRMPWEVLTAEWQDYQVVSVLERRRERDWRSGLSIRLGLEIAPHLFR
jgi:hypothetical protein